MARVALAVTLLAAGCGVGAQDDPVALVGDPHVTDPRAVPAADEARQWAQLHHDLADAHQVQLDAWARLLEAERHARRAARQRARTTADDVVTVHATGDLFDALAQCESGMRNVSSGRYLGYFQFLPSTWSSLGLPGMPHHHSYAVQKQAAQQLVARSGWGQFPVCSRKIGAR